LVGVEVEVEIAEFPTWSEISQDQKNEFSSIMDLDKIVIKKNIINVLATNFNERVGRA
jgi:hypothetical protein